jgi:nitrate reductase gamma subunit
MLPWKKESARLYPASYLLGVLYHAGTFLGFGWLVVLFFDIGVPAVAARASTVFVSVAALCGLALLAKRIASSNLRYFSSPDDYFSNILVTGWQVLIAAALLRESLIPALMVCSCVLFLYIPVGKLRHAIYFIPARVYLGIFYGRRGVWPVRERRSWRV